MQFSRITLLGFLICLSLTTGLEARTFFVASQAEFNAAHDSAAANDSIVWRPGTYADIYLGLDKDSLVITAQTLGGTVFNGSSAVELTADDVTLRGFQWVDGNIGRLDLIVVSGSRNVLTQLNIRNVRAYKYLRVRAESQYVDISYCNFENRPNLDDQNILSILVDNDQPGYHKIRHCSFKNFNGSGNDLGIEPIRIGVSSQKDFISRTLVEYCYFTQCNGDGELISSKARQNVYRYNTFERNPLAELVLRHGSENIVYGNFFLRGKGGVRVREGQDQYIYNNYFYFLTDRAIFLQNEDSDPLDNINIAFNTIIDCNSVRLGGSGNDAPTRVTIANNIFTGSNDALFREPTGTETWIGNIAFGDLGATLPANGITVVDPQLEQNSAGFFGLTATSPAIDAAQPGYAPLPQFPGIDSIDTELMLDLMRQRRPDTVTLRDLGANEFPHDTLIQPIATEENTGPVYNTSSLTGTSTISAAPSERIRIFPNPVTDQLSVIVDSEVPRRVALEIYDLTGSKVLTLAGKTVQPGPDTITNRIGGLTAGLYTLRATFLDLDGGPVGTQVIKFVKP